MRGKHNQKAANQERTEVKEVDEVLGIGQGSMIPKQVKKRKREPRELGSKRLFTVVLQKGAERGGDACLGMARGRSE